MLKMSQNIRHTRSTLKMEGIAPTSAFTTTCVEYEHNHELETNERFLRTTSTLT